MPIYNLLEYSKNYRKTTGSLWNYYRDESNNLLSSNSESFKYKASITGNTYDVGAGEAGYDADKVCKNETEIVVPLKHLSNFWRTLNIPLINSEIGLIPKIVLYLICQWELQEIMMTHQQLLHQLD